MNFGRVLTAMVTPFDEDLRVDYDQAAALAERLLANGSDGIVVSGTTGESATLTVDERAKLWKLIKEVVGKRGVVVAGAGNNCTQESIELTAIATESGVDAIMLVVPYYNNPPQEGLYRHFKAIACSTSLPVMLYNIPSRSVRSIDARTILRLAHDVPNIVAVKEGGRDIEQVIEVCRDRPEGFLVYSGDDASTLAWLAMGASGVVSVASHVVGKEIQQMIGSFFAGNHERAADIHASLLPVFKAMFCTTNPIPVKAALNLQGFDVGGLRLPLIEATEQQRETVRRSLDALGLLGTPATI